MPAQLLISRRAQRDIEEVLLWTRDHFGEHKCDEYRELIRLALTKLVSDPDSARRRPEIHPDARTFHIGVRGRQARHLFIVRAVDANVVEVVRLIHDAMDISRHADLD